MPRTFCGRRRLRVAGVQRATAGLRCACGLQGHTWLGTATGMALTRTWGPRQRPRWCEVRMASWRFVCTKREAISHPVPHTHIVEVGTGERADWADMRWALCQVLTAKDEGDTFHTQSETTGQVTAVEKHRCPDCDRTHIRSASGSTRDSDLNNLRNCIYGSEGSASRLHAGDRTKVERPMGLQGAEV